MQLRVENLRGAMASAKLDALLVTQPENRRYLSGFTGSAAVLILTADRMLLATDFRYFDQVGKQAPDWELVQVTGSVRDTLAATIADLGPSRVGYESHDLTVDTFEQWRSAIPNIEWVATHGLVEEFRQIKEAAEVEVLQEAVRIADEAMVHIMDWIHPGVTEREVSWELEVYMRTHGAEALSFTTIVGSGPNGAMSHAVVSDRPIYVGDAVVIDMGARYKGYCSDLTRSFCLGEASEAYLTVWNKVLEAQEAVERRAKGGMTGVEVDAIARDLIYEAGYKGKFGHGLGHGVGLAIHEEPRASFTYTGVLNAGTVITVEPGIYLPGEFGVRIEDMVILTPDGCRVLTQSPKVPVVGAV